MFLTESAFILPPLYVKNQRIIDARIQQIQAIINTEIKIAQDYASEKVTKIKDSYMARPTSKKE